MMRDADQKVMLGAVLQHPIRPAGRSAPAHRRARAGRGAAFRAHRDRDQRLADPGPILQTFATDRALEEATSRCSRR